MKVLFINRVLEVDDIVYATLTSGIDTEVHFYLSGNNDPFMWTGAAARALWDVLERTSSVKDVAKFFDKTSGVA